MPAMLEGAHGRLRRSTHIAIASRDAARQSTSPMDCFATLAMTTG
jgi:hypothetical protein